ncbi:MAG: 3-hydroxyacyl-CoA dehydrogenase NAD-binding domain-containing protein [Pseudomonadota bacterium]
MTTPIQTRVDGSTLIITLDAPDARVNVIDPAFTRALADIVQTLETDDSLDSAIITSAKPSFVVGGDLSSLEKLSDTETISPQRRLDLLTEFPKLLRRLERCGKTVIAAVNGTAMGGGLELALACHHRIIADDPAIQLALPEVKLGLMPGAGGTQRLPRLIGIERAAPFLLTGRSLSPQEALALGLADRIVDLKNVVAEALSIIRGDDARTVQPWDQRGFTLPGGSNILDLKWTAFYYNLNGKLQADTLHNYPAPKAIASALYEGNMLTLDAGLEIEARYMASLFETPVATNMIRSLFINRQKADKLAFRPEAGEPLTVKRLGIIGAGMMGSGIALVAAQAGIHVYLLDSDLTSAQRGKATVEARLAKGVERGRVSEADKALWIGQIEPTDRYDNFADCEMVIEAVFEDPEIKAQVTRAATEVMKPGAIFATNTSTLRISSLATASPRPDRFIGLHFFSPVDRMPLVEIICGDETSDATLGQAMDFVRQIAKTPIVVNDAWGFYTSRCFSTFTAEGMAMLEDGVHPALIENAARFCGMPVGPLTVQDEVSLELSHNVQTSLRDLRGDDYAPTASDRVIERMVVEARRPGRRAGKGFYDYPSDGPKTFWPELQTLYPLSETQPSLEAVKTRFLYRQAVEAARCLDEGVLDRPEDGDLGALLGWGFPSYTGGPLSLIDSVGVGAFVEACDGLAAMHGDRFSPPDLLRRLAAEDRSIYDAFSEAA